MNEIPEQFIKPGCNILCCARVRSSAALYLRSSPLRILCYSLYLE